MNIIAIKTVVSQSILKLARTIADLAEHEIIQINDMAEAIQYRPRRLGL